MRFHQTIPALAGFRENVKFRDIMPMLANPEALAFTQRQLLDWARPLEPDYVAAVDARGFIFGGALALGLNCGFLAIRKKGKLPGETVGKEFTGEYATDYIEMRTDLFPPGAKILLHDDIVATGNCTRAAAQLIESLGGEVVGICSILEKAFLGGRKKISGYKFKPVFVYEA
ncbi:adenine phosphoribosyltransferase [Micromonospora sp. STR1_7]|uniref:adenine phosphoribosyltransferase n=1 Tax=Micromonospora parastrephiae TaxID=2806101 RepID=A0ABS1XN81_9ACTN|nr:adenine phosphoribosyltransferase [Micromonospora parastrephiae]MBM0230715.1 adenine phosphoribosyltransferase [Micromonospora parastrephiae]